mmetsp:Transcript_67953/g.210184  ORF Transcript_67953/g.210184 Transcript_67953/m.210184 type:complete len:280 (-) Transcript_67953:179-1018(-)
MTVELLLSAPPVGLNDAVRNAYSIDVCVHGVDVVAVLALLDLVLQRHEDLVGAPDPREGDSTPVQDGDRPSRKVDRLPERGVGGVIAHVACELPLVVRVGAHPVSSRLRQAPVRCVLRDADDEIVHRLAPPVRDEPLRHLHSGGHEFDIGALPGFRRRLNQQRRQVVEVHRARAQQPRLGWVGGPPTQLGAIIRDVREDSAQLLHCDGSLLGLLDAATVSAVELAKVWKRRLLVFLRRRVGDNLLGRGCAGQRGDPLARRCATAVPLGGYGGAASGARP